MGQETGLILIHLETIDTNRILALAGNDIKSSFILNGIGWIEYNLACRLGLFVVRCLVLFIFILAGNNNTGLIGEFTSVGILTNLARRDAILDTTLDP